jgi:hypothetical protein
MKRGVLSVMCLLVLLASPAGAESERDYTWATSLYGDIDGIGQDVYPGGSFDIFSLDTYLPAADGYDFLDKCAGRGDEPLDDTGEWIKWEQPGFPSMEKITAAQLCIVHGGYKEGELYLYRPNNRHPSSDADLIKIGVLQASEINGENILVQDCFDLTKYGSSLRGEELILYLKIPRLPGSFSVDNGVVDYIEVNAYGG